MNIYEAAIQARELGKHMKRNAWRTASVNVESAVYGLGGHTMRETQLFSAGKRWAPKAADVFADDWELCEPMCDTEPRPAETTVKYAQENGASKRMRRIALATALISLVFSIVALLLK